MGGIYGLSESQRESINNFNNIKEGEILAVKGPPGTGKTTLIQSIVANEYVKRALKKDEPPLIVASSTNNQAVTNIIESFGKIKRKFKQNNLEERWIENVDSFAIYFPSKNKRKQAKEKNFQYTDNRGDFFVAEIEKEENIKKSKEKFIKEASKFLKNEEKIDNITIYKNKIHERLRKINQIQNELINIVSFFENLGINDIEKYLEEKQQKINSIKDNKKYTLWKILSFIKKYKNKISNRLKLYVNEEEFFQIDLLDINYIEEYYSKIIEKKNEEIRKLQLIIKEVEKNKISYENNFKELEKFDVKEEKIITNKKKWKNG